MGGGSTEKQKCGNLAIPPLQELTGRLGERDLAHEGVRLGRVREGVHRNVAPGPSGLLVPDKSVHNIVIDWRQRRKVVAKRRLLKIVE